MPTLKEQVINLGISQGVIKDPTTARQEQGKPRTYHAILGMFYLKQNAADHREMDRIREKAKTSPLTETEKIAFGFDKLEPGF